MSIVTFLRRPAIGKALGNDYVEQTNKVGIYERLAQRGHHVKRFVEEVESRRPTDEEISFLQITRAQHVLEVTRLACDRVGRVLEVTVNVFPSNLWRLSYEWSADE